MNSLDVFENAGLPARHISPLLWGLIGLSVVVVVLVAIAVAAAIVVRRRGSHEPPHIATKESRRGLVWIYSATAVSTLVLVVCIGWTFVTMADVSNPAQAAGVTIDVGGAQWWWRYGYQQQSDQPGLVTANELHIPIGVPVRLRITSSDVIHSFWVPALAGKTDAVPGQVNDAWLQADKPGVYRGQCAEFCGQQHSQMAMFIFAEPEPEFEAWRAHQAADAVPPADPAVQALFDGACGECHTVRGTPAKGTRGPDLTHLMTRDTIAAGVLTNTRGNLAGWIADPQGIKPGAKMPVVPLSGPELQSILDYMATLK